MMDEERDFLCFRCCMRIKYHYFGKKPPFSRNIILLEETYVMKDPFSSEAGMISLGSHCSLCQKSVCASPDCSIFYSKRFCLPCVLENFDDFPVEIQQELRKKNMEKR